MAIKVEPTNSINRLLKWESLLYSRIAGGGLEQKQMKKRFFRFFVIFGNYRKHSRINFCKKLDFCEAWKIILHFFLNSAGIPETYHFGSEGTFDALVMECLGHSLEHLFSRCGGNFSLKTVLMIADQCVSFSSYS